MKLSKLLHNFTDQPLTKDPEISGLQLDSRKVEPGNLFIAYPGETQDGRMHIAQAIRQGAAAVVQETGDITHSAIPIINIEDCRSKVGHIAKRYFDAPSQKLKVVGVTGTNGKTSCTHLIAQALNYCQNKAAVMGTLGVGFLDSLNNTGLTTPDAIAVQRGLADIVKAGGQAVAMEVSSHSLVQNRVNGVDFDVAVFTNLTRDHLDYHDTLEAYGAAKRKLFEQPGLRHAVINADDHFGQRLIRDFESSLSVVAYGLSKPHAKQAVYVENPHFSSDGVEAKIITPWGSGFIKYQCIGDFNLSNLLVVISTLGSMGLPFNDLLALSPRLSGVPGRMEFVGGGDRPLGIVDYAHTPDALENVLRTARQNTKGKLICVFGCGGDRDRGKRPMMAKVSERYADLVVVTSDNPRTEDPESILRNICEGFSKNAPMMKVSDRAKAIQYAVNSAERGDVIVVAGKGHENMQIINNKKLPFDDRLELRKVLDLYPSP
ncbi:MAG: UDP-N-acetylmuramoyl-L-alanyl-D-glutamate--2,6-diaminopimelate ligase [Gammaproteobacteria bacterium]